VKNGNGRWAMGIIAAAILSIALTALYASTGLGGKVDGNTKDIAYIQQDIQQEQKAVQDQLKWQRNALRSIATKVGAELPPEG